jgi:hypothetical protein
MLKTFYSFSTSFTYLFRFSAKTSIMQRNGNSVSAPKKGEAGTFAVHT